MRTIASPLEAVFPSDPEAIASVHQVTKRYPNGVLALNQFTLNLHRGEVVALLGPNGAGKSTTIRLLLGMSAPTTGTVRIFGADPRATATRRHIGAMLQVGRAPEMLRVREHLAIFRGYYPAPRPYADLVQAAGLAEIEDRMFGELSGGQKQRALFAMALAGNPELLLLDEPTVGLDIQSRRGIWAEVRAMTAQGKTVLLTTHSLEEAEALATRVVLIQKGKMLCEGTPEQIKSMGAETTGLLAAKTIRCATIVPEQTLRALAGVVRVEAGAERTTIVSTQAEATLRALFPLDPALHALEVQSPALEDAFLALTRDAQ